MVDHWPCRFCGDRSMYPVCPPCWRALPWNACACPHCALPVVVEGPCARCRRRPPPAALACAPFTLASPIREVLHGLKYHGRLADARWLAAAVALARRQRPEPIPDLLLPVPLHRGRLWRRGFNQAAVLGAELAPRMGCRWQPALMTRQRATPDQIGQSPAARRRGVAAAFSVGADIHAASVAVIDDVMTTGATLDEVARCLRRAGAARVEVWAVARTPPGGARFPAAAESAMIASWMTPP